jgi:hypothetical protein
MYIQLPLLIHSDALIKGPLNGAIAPLHVALSAMWDT